MDTTIGWTVKAFFFNSGKYELQEWASGFTYTTACNYYQNLHNSNKFAKITMETSTETGVTIQNEH